MFISTGLQPETALVRVPSPPGIPSIRVYDRFFPVPVPVEEIWVTRLLTTHDTEQHPAGHCVDVLMTAEEPRITKRGAKGALVRSMSAEDRKHYRAQMAHQHRIPSDAVEASTIFGLNRDVEEITFEWYELEV